MGEARIPIEQEERMDWLALETARQRRRELLCERSKWRLTRGIRNRRFTARRRVGRLMLGVGNFFVRLGSSLE